MDRDQQRNRRMNSTAGRERAEKVGRRPPSRSSGPVSRSRDGVRSAEKQRSRSAYERQNNRKRQLRRQKQQRKIELAEQRRAEAQRRPVRPFARRNFFLRLGMTMAVVLALVVVLTIFFKVDSVLISGNVKYSAQEIIDASGIQIGENLLLLRKSGVAGRIHANLPYVGDIQVGIKLPDTVNIDIVEQSAVFVMEDTKGCLWLLSHDGTVLEATEYPLDDDYILIKGAIALAPVVGEELKIVRQDDETNALGDGTTVDRRTVIMEIMDELTACDRSGNITVIDVTKLQDIQIWYGNAYQVLFSEPTNLRHKVRYMVQAIEELARDGYRGGVLDLSFREDEKSVFTPW